jgi:glycosyltransferase involved in cell wall biosynthesis
MSDATVICIVPVKNESWILGNFLACAQKWADHIIVGDHNSEDGSERIAQDFGGVQVVPLRDPSYDESTRRRVLIEEARRISKRGLIISIDADEMLSANWFKSPEWSLMRRSPPGTSFQFNWLELLPGLGHCAVYGMTAAFVDDGTDYVGQRIHSPRIPCVAGAQTNLTEIKLLHYIALDTKRMLSRHNWYKCLEFIEHGQSAWDMSIKYQDTTHKTYDAPIIAVQSEWLAGYDWLNDYRAGSNACPQEQAYWWDNEVLNYFDRHGADRFRRLNIWDVDWNEKARMSGRHEVYADPRNRMEQCVHRFIEWKRKELKYGTNVLYRALNRFGHRLW